MTSNAEDHKNFISRISGYEKASAIIWLVLGIIQILLGLEIGIFIIIGIWNIVVSVSRFKMVDRIRNLDPTIPNEYEGIVGLIIFGIVNLVLGALLGIAGIIIDFYVRDQILKNRDLFNPDIQKQIAISRVAHSTEDSYQLLAKLGKLRDQNIITEEEFASEKAKILK